MANKGMLGRRAKQNAKLRVIQEKRKLRECRARLRTDMGAAVYESVLFPDRCRHGVPPQEEQMSVCWQQVIRHHVLGPKAPHGLPPPPALPNAPKNAKTPLLGSREALLSWGPEDVSNWAKGLKFLPSPGAVAKTVLDEAIDGEALLSLSQKDLQRAFGLRLGPAQFSPRASKTSRLGSTILQTVLLR